VHKRPEAQGPTWHVAKRPGKRRKLNTFIEPDFVAERVEKMKASIRAKVEDPFRVIKRQLGFTKVRYRGLAKNTAQIVTLFALSNLWMTGWNHGDECARSASHEQIAVRNGCAVRVAKGAERLREALRRHAGFSASMAIAVGVVQTFRSNRKPVEPHLLTSDRLQTQNESSI